MKTKYEEMSDFEINKLICEHLPVAIDANQDAVPSVVVVDSWTDDAAHAINPVERWDIMGPLITDCKISIGFEREGDSSEKGWWAYDGVLNGLEFNILVSAQDNPLRAAAIVYLMIKDGEK